MDPIQILGRLGTDNPPTNQELEQARTMLLEALDAATSGDTPDLAVARDLRDALDKVTSEQSARSEQSEAARAEAARLREGLFQDSAEDEDEDEEDEDEDEDSHQEPEPVAASAQDIISRLTAHARATTRDRSEDKPSVPGAVLKPIGPAAGFELDADGDFEQLGQLFSTHAHSVAGGGTSSRLVRLERHYDQDRTLGSNVDQNNSKLAAVFGTGTRTTPVAAAGGLCGPGDVDHSHPICSDRGRPVKNALVQFNAARGRLQYAPSAALGDLEGNVSVWTSDTDSNPGTATKPCPPLVCPEELSESIDAVVKCITVGNFQAKFSPEFWASRLELALVAHDRLAEQKAIAEIHAEATNLTDVAPATGNSLQNFLQTVNTIISGDRAVNRRLSGGYIVLTDAFVRDAIRNHVIENLGVANNVDAIQVADAEINGWLSDVGAEAVWTYDGTVDADTGLHRVVTPGTMPTHATVYVFPREAYLFLDGGTLDLGTSITDSSLNATNDRQAFSESFEKVAFRGCSSYRVEIQLVSNCGCS